MMSRRDISSLGLTLFEVLLAVVLVVVLVGAMFGLYSDAVNVRADINAKMRAIDDQRLVMERITTELTAAMEFKFLQMGLEGDEVSATWTTTGLPGPQIWVELDATDDPPPVESDIQIVGYRLRYAEDEEGELFVVGLERTCQKMFTAQIIEEEDEDGAGESGRGVIRATLLSDAVKFVRFRYYDGSSWAESWDEGLPAAVEVTLGLDPPGEDEEPADYSGRAFKRVIALPGATCASSGGIRGL